jgi:hypothetical protein
LGERRHSPDELAALQGLLDASGRSGGAALREAFEPEGHMLSAAQLAAYFDRVRPFAVATVTDRGEPRVAPVGAVFYRAMFHIPTADYARRVVHVRHRPVISVTHFVLGSIAVIVHGRAEILTASHPDFETLEALHDGGAWWREIRAKGSGVYLRVDAERAYSWAADPGAFPRQ